MSTAVAAIEDYLIVNGPAKAAVIARATHVSETTTRKALKALEDEGKVIKDGQQFVCATKSRRANANTQRRDEVTQRDQLVLKIVQTHASKDGESISRTDIVDLLKKDGHKFTGSFVYLSLYRLNALGNIERVHVGKRAPEWRIANAGE